MPSLSLVPELECLVDASGGAGGHRSPEDPLLGGQVDLHGGVTPGVVDLIEETKSLYMC